jgi:hypothetical protein
VKFFVLLAIFFSTSEALAVSRSWTLLLGPERLVSKKQTALVPALRYDIVITQRFYVGFTLAYRHFNPDYSQVGYGTLLGHHIPVDDSQGFVVEYGLLNAMGFAKGATHSALAHDTRLAGGYYIENFEATLGFHISTLRYYNAENENQNRVAFTVGYKFRTAVTTQSSPSNQN